jgi:hypothetical protein
LFRGSNGRKGFDRAWKAFFTHASRSQDASGNAWLFFRNHALRIVYAHTTPFCYVLGMTNHRKIMEQERAKWACAQIGGPDRGHAVGTGSGEPSHGRQLCMIC